MFLSSISFLNIIDDNVIIAVILEAYKIIEYEISIEVRNFYKLIS